MPLVGSADLGATRVGSVSRRDAGSAATAFEARVFPFAGFDRFVVSVDLDHKALVAEMSRGVDRSRSPRRDSRAL